MRELLLFVGVWVLTVIAAYRIGRDDERLVEMERDAFRRMDACIEQLRAGRR